MKIVLCLIAILAITACSDSSDQVVEKKEATVKSKSINKDHLLKGYQDNLQKAKDMGEDVKKTAERQKKAIEEASK